VFASLATLVNRTAAGAAATLESTTGSDAIVHLATQSQLLMTALQQAMRQFQSVADLALATSPTDSASISVMKASGAFDAAVQQFRGSLDPTRQAAADTLLASGGYHQLDTLLPAFIGDSRTAPIVEATLVAAMARIDALEIYSASFFEQQVATASRVEQRAASMRRTAIVELILTALLSLVLLALAVRSILRPLHSLVRRSREVSAGHLDVPPLALSGPSDLRVVTRAFNDMSTTLQASQQQMDRLADGHLEPDESLPGPLGDTLRRSVSHLADVTYQLHASQAAAMRQARTDSLTGLANRTAVLERLAVMTAEARQTGRHGAVVFIDLDGFKSVNDTQGHAEGDRILDALAQRVRAACPDHLVARIGGDELLVLVHPAGTKEATLALAHELIAIVGRPCTGSSGQVFTLSASAGIAEVDGTREPLEVIAQADSAVYHAKEKGRGRVEAFDGRLARVIEERAQLALTMRQGLSDGEFSLELQPIIEIANKQPIGAEVLLRWNRNGSTAIGPTEFIPIAERTGRIVDLETWVLHQVVGILRDWRLDPVTARMRLAVNISGRHIIDGDLVGLLTDLCTRASVDPRLLDLEITETHLVADIGRARSVVDELRRTGINVAIDDFGTGYSSMTYLHQLTVDTLKIDQVFVAGICDDRLDRTIVELLLRLGDSLGMRVVAEGVDDEAKLAVLQELGCHWAQGFHIARPMPVADATAWLRQQAALAASLA
jgi:diguanylate cyclase (GGDEF)-like protein